jgi:Asp-tRNA(Asn)/Glu-tRNA(Gln) amidotransferase A subunit family amidase
MGLSWTMDKIGPICRGVEDCAAALDAIYGPDGHDLTVGDAPFNWLPETPLSSLRIGYLKTEFETTPPRNATEQQRKLTEQRNAMYKDALAALEKAGVKMTPIELPKFPTGNIRFLLTAEAAAAFDDITRDGRVNQLSGQDANDWPNSFRTSRFIPAVEYLRAQRLRVLLMREMDKLMSQWDVFVAPAPNSASLTITNLTGHPAVCVPCGFLDVPQQNGPAQHLPQAIMFTGGLYDEASPLRVALAFEKATNWHTMHPKVDWA